MVLCKLQTQVYANLHAASPSSAPLTRTDFRWFVHFSGENSGVQDIKVKMKNNAKFNEKLSVRVKAVVNEDAQITIQEIAEVLDILPGVYQTF